MFCFVSVFAPLIPLIGHRAVLGLSGYVLNNIAFVLAAVYFYKWVACWLILLFLKAINSIEKHIVAIFWCSNGKLMLNIKWILRFAVDGDTLEEGYCGEVWYGTCWLVFWVGRGVIRAGFQGAVRKGWEAFLPDSDLQGGWTWNHILLWYLWWRDSS